MFYDIRARPLLYHYPVFLTAVLKQILPEISNKKRKEVQL